MSRISNTAKSLLVAATLGLSVLASTTAPASAFGLAILTGCPAGEHIGYEGKYCWPNRPQTCPAGFHLGYEGKYCWPNR